MGLWCKGVQSDRHPWEEAFNAQGRGTKLSFRGAMHRGPYSRRNDTCYRSARERIRAREKSRGLCFITGAENTTGNAVRGTRTSTGKQHHKNHKRKNKNCTARANHARTTNAGRTALLYICFISLYTSYFRVVFKPILNLHRRSDTQFLARF